MSTSKTVTVFASVHWLNTNVALTKGQTFTIRATGQWSANPSFYGDTDASGVRMDNKALAYTNAKSGYTLPGAPESILVGYIGDFEPSGAPPAGSTFPLACASEIKVTAQATGTLFLSINDDVEGKYGKGYTDNRGSLSVTITTG